MVKIDDTIRGFKKIIAGDCDHLPLEAAFYMVGTIEEVERKSKNIIINFVMEKIKLEIISPEGIVISCDCMFISLPSTEGIIEIRFGHETNCYSIERR